MQGPLLTNGLIWGYDFVAGAAIALGDPEPGDAAAAAAFRWLHFNAADRGSERWIKAAALPSLVGDLLLSHDDHQRALVDGDWLACVLHDYQRELDDQKTAGVGTLRFAISDRLLLTLRRHPLRCADIARHRIVTGRCPDSANAALELLTSSVIEVMSGELQALEAAVEHIEDELLTDSLTPDTSELVAMRRRALRLHRLLAGMGTIARRLEPDSALSPLLLPAIENFAQRVAALDQGATAVQSQLRLLRDELELQTAQRTNRSLYVLSILSALMLPATLVTGLFGMNTGGLPWASSSIGTVMATLMAASSALAVYLVLRKLGFVKL
ncbi:CorA family divalent cation transporter [Hydrocarboniphaga sp.]|uniref:CorA family divalent cation transporter n=1 Tax=Hydrocarboniphaga sp. TaxID=2033016 RepID=UPI003D0B9950